MPKMNYSYKFGKEMPLLTDDEYAPIAKLLLLDRAEVAATPPEEGEKFKRMMMERWQQALDLYEDITGIRLDNHNDLWAVNLTQYGRPCAACSKLFRTPKAKLCASCGFELPPGETAGPYG